MSERKRGDRRTGKRKHFESKNNDRQDGGWLKRVVGDWLYKIDSGEAGNGKTKSRKQQHMK